MGRVIGAQAPSFEVGSASFHSTIKCHPSPFSIYTCEVQAWHIIHSTSWSMDQQVYVGDRVDFMSGPRCPGHWADHNLGARSIEDTFLVLSSRGRSTRLLICSQIEGL